MSNDLTDIINCRCSRDADVDVTFMCLFDRSALTDGRRAVVLKADWHKVDISDSPAVATSVSFFS